MNKNEYDYPDIYAAENDNFKDDFNVYIGVKTTGKVLDLASGNGHLTIELAKSGLKATGLEISKSMIDYAIIKSKKLNINYVHSNIKNFNFNTKFDLITMAGNSFQALLNCEDQLSMFECVKAHLKLDGIFVFDTRRPTIAELKTTTQYEHWHDFTLLDGEKVQVYGVQNYNEKNS